MIPAIACLFALQTGETVRAPVLVTRPHPENPLRIAGAVALSLEVSPDGKPENVRIVRPLHATADHAAMESVRRWTFQPALKADGHPVRFRSTAEIPFRGPAIWYGGQPNVTIPMLLKRVEPTAVDKGIEGKVLISLEVSEQGKAEQLCVLWGIDPATDQIAIEAVKQWWFRPGRKGREAVRVEIVVEVPFRKR